MEFEKRKAQVLAAISAPVADKSPKGTLDAPIVPLLGALNRHPSHFTTSSCSGRISIFCHAPAAGEATEADCKKDERNAKVKKKGGGGGWIFVTHDPADPEAVVDLLFGGRSPAGLAGGALVFRYEPLIIAVDCRDLASAQALVSIAISCGFRESGITSIHKRIMVAIRSSTRLEVPLGHVDSIVVSAEYVRYLVGIANEKMETNKRRTDGFLHVFQYKGFPGLEQEKIDSNKKDQGWVYDKEILLDLEAKQIDVLSKITLLETDALNSHNLDSISRYVKSSNDSESAGCSGKEMSGSPNRSLCVVMLMIIGEPIEKLYLWGQSACTVNYQGQKQIIVFGGFGGIGQHARRNYSLMLDPQSGMLKEIDVPGPPSPRMGHTSSVVRDCVFIIGGRGGPTQILNDVWVLYTAENKWKSLECMGSVFHPRHRHAAAVVGSNIYVFGGLNNEVIYSCMHVLNTENLQWSEVIIQGDWPSARHSHSLVANGHRLYLFGGYDGEKALGDLCSFDVRTHVWRHEKTTGRAPFPRFSHSMFVYYNYLGIIGGCPVSQQYEQLALLNLDHQVWMHVTIDSIGSCLWLRSSTSVVGEDLVIVCGGASCYAFGTKFNQPMKLNLRLLDSVSCMPSDTENKPIIRSYKGIVNRSSQSNNHLQATIHSSDQNIGIDFSSTGEGSCTDDKELVLQLEKNYAKLAKDILKNFGWLDLSRKAQRSQDGCHIRFPITRNFYALHKKRSLISENTFDNLDDFHQIGASASKGLSKNEVSLPMALNFLLSCGGSLWIDDIAFSRKASKAPKETMRELVSALLRKKGMNPQLLDQLPTRWDRLGDIAVLPVTSFKNPIWDSIGQELWMTVAKSLGTQRLARQGRILPTGTRDSTLEILVGDNGWVTHQENGILYSFDATKCMFSSGNFSEKLRMAHLDCGHEVIVDLFAGIGYFVLPFLVKAKAKLVYACEWNPHALKALQHNVHANSVADRCVILEGDNCATAPKRVADRVCLGLLPSSENSWATAVGALRAEGGTLHVHGNVKDSEEGSWLDYAVKSISSIAQSQGLCWDVTIHHLERVKSYGPHIRHLVADVRCKQV